MTKIIFFFFEGEKKRRELDSEMVNVFYKEKEKDRGGGEGRKFV